MQDLSILQFIAALVLLAIPYWVVTQKGRAQASGCLSVLPFVLKVPAIGLACLLFAAAPARCTSRFK